MAAEIAVTLVVREDEDDVWLAGFCAYFGRLLVLWFGRVGLL